MQAAVFSRRAYPNPGDIPVLNRKVFRATRVQISEHPYVVSVRRRHVHYVTGAILTPHVVITVAHPIYNVSLTELGVVAGENYCDRGAALMTVLLVLLHEDFRPYDLKADLALLRLYETIFTKSSQKPIPLFNEFKHIPGKRQPTKRNDNSLKAFVTGWGRCDWLGNELCLPRSSVYFPAEKLDPMLRSISFNHSHLAVSSYCVGYEKLQIKIDNWVGMMCLGSAREAEPLAPCLAAPGAPLVVQGQLAGLLSWGFGCGYTHDLPLVYTDLRFYNGWLITSVSKLNKLNTSDVAELYIAAKAYLMQEWLVETTGRRPAAVPRPEAHLRPAGVDYDLIKLSGYITDFRDYAYGGVLSGPKEELYRTLKAELEHKRKLALISRKIMLNREPSKPFLSKPDLIDSSI